MIACLGYKLDSDIKSGYVFPKLNVSVACFLQFEFVVVGDVFDLLLVLFLDFKHHLAQTIISL